MSTCSCYGYVKISTSRVLLLEVKKMIRLIGRTGFTGAVLILLAMLISCGGGGSGGGSGTLVLGLTDASTDDYQAIYVTIAAVQVNKAAPEKTDGAEDGDESGWQTILTPNMTYNLLELVNGVIENLGIVELEAGKYNQMRLILADQPDDSLNILGNPHPYANYLVDSEDNEKELKVPSGLQTGIKIVKGFTIVASQSTELVLDFDAKKSVVQAGKSGKCLLKPTIKVLETVVNSVVGTVGDGAEPLAGVLVSAQVYDAGAADAKDEVAIESSTLTSDSGGYVLYLAPGTYNIVAVQEGYEPACVETAATGFEEYAADFSLELAAASGTAAGTVEGLAVPEDFAVLSFRRQLDCGTGVDVPVEVKAINVAEGGSYSVSLPAGNYQYQLVASAAGEDTQEFDLSIEDGVDTVLDINF